MKIVFHGLNDCLNLNNLKKVTDIYFKRTSIETLDISGCEKLKNLTIIDMEKGARWNVPDISKNMELESLVLDKNALIQGDLEKIIGDLIPKYDGDELKSGAPYLKELVLSRNEFNSMSPLSNLSGKTSNFILNVSDNNIIDLNGIENLTNLSELDISNNPGITNITPILTLKSNSLNSLEKVKISGCSGITLDMKSSLEKAGITVEE